MLLWLAPCILYLLQSLLVVPGWSCSWLAIDHFLDSIVILVLWLPLHFPGKMSVVFLATVLFLNVSPAVWSRDDISCCTVIASSTVDVPLNLYRTNVTASVMQPCCWPNVAATVMQCMHEFIQLSPCLLETETQTNSTVVPTTGLAFVRSHYVIFGGLGFDIIYGCTWPLGSAEGVTDTIH